MMTEIGPALPGPVVESFDFVLRIDEREEIHLRRSREAVRLLCQVLLDAQMLLSRPVSLQSERICKEVLGMAPDDVTVETISEDAANNKVLGANEVDKLQFLLLDCLSNPEIVHSPGFSHFLTQDGLVDAEESPGSEDNDERRLEKSDKNVEMAAEFLLQPVESTRFYIPKAAEHGKDFDVPAGFCAIWQFQVEGGYDVDFTAVFLPAADSPPETVVERQDSGEGEPNELETIPSGTPRDDVERPLSSSELLDEFFRMGQTDSPSAPSLAYGGIRVVQQTRRIASRQGSTERWVTGSCRPEDGVSGVLRLHFGNKYSRFTGKYVLERCQVVPTAAMDAAFLAAEEFSDHQERPISEIYGLLLNCQKVEVSVFLLKPMDSQQLPPGVAAKGASWLSFLSSSREEELASASKPPPPPAAGPSSRAHADNKPANSSYPAWMLVAVAAAACVPVAGPFVAAATALAVTVPIAKPYVESAWKKRFGKEDEPVAVPPTAEEEAPLPERVESPAPTDNVEIDDNRCQFCGAPDINCPIHSQHAAIPSEVPENATSTEFSKALRKLASKVGLARKKTRDKSNGEVAPGDPDQRLAKTFDVIKLIQSVDSLEDQLGVTRAQRDTFVAVAARFEKQLKDALIKAHLTEERLSKTEIELMLWKDEQRAFLSQSRLDGGASIYPAAVTPREDRVGPTSEQKLEMAWNSLLSRMSECASGVQDRSGLAEEAGDEVSPDPCCTALQCRVLLERSGPYGEELQRHCSSLQEWQSALLQNKLLEARLGAKAAEDDANDVPTLPSMETIASQEKLGVVRSLLDAPSSSLVPDYPRDDGPLRERIDLLEQELQDTNSLLADARLSQQHLLATRDAEVLDLRHRLKSLEHALQMASSQCDQFVLVSATLKRKVSTLKAEKKVLVGELRALRDLGVYHGSSNSAAPLKTVENSDSKIGDGDSRQPEASDTAEDGVPETVPLSSRSEYTGLSRSLNDVIGRINSVSSMLQADPRNPVLEEMLIQLTQDRSELQFRLSQCILRES